MKLYISCVLILGCICCSSITQKHKGYTYNEKGFYYKLAGFSDSYNKAQVSDYVTATVRFSSVGSDSLNIQERFVIQVSNDDSVCLPSLLLDFKQGDSISFIVPNTPSIRNLLSQEIANMFANLQEIELTVSIHSVVDTKTFARQQKEYEQWAKSRHEFEMSSLSNYLNASHYHFELSSQGIYKYILKQGAGTSPEKGDIVTISYQGSLLNGKIINPVTSMEFTLGSQWQVISGVERAIHSMKEGERALILIPSEYAWGTQGSSDGSIQPFTTILYDLELRSVQKLKE